MREATTDEVNECPKCQGSGYVVQVMKDGTSGAAPCSCFANRMQSEREQHANIPLRFCAASFESWDPSATQTKDGRSNAFRLVKHYVREFPIGRKQGLLLTGPPGTGKTHLAVAAMKDIMAKGFSCVFFDYQSLIAAVQRGWSKEASRSDREAFDIAVRTDVLVLDDLGAQRNLEWVENVITDIITSRYNAMKAIIITTNLPDPLFHLPSSARTIAEVIGERSRSRLMEMCTVVTMANIDDYRLQRR